MARETPGNGNGTREPAESCPRGVPAEMCINFEVTGWGCAECTRPARKDGNRDAR